MVKALVMLTGPKDLGGYSFVVPQQLRETLAPSVALEAAGSYGSPSR